VPTSCSARWGFPDKYLAKSQNAQDYEGTLHIHRELVAAIAEGRPALTSFRDCLGTMRLIEQLEGGPYSAAERPASAVTPTMV
jgi:hypothetical protein